MKEEGGFHSLFSMVVGVEVVEEYIQNSEMEKLR